MIFITPLGIAESNSRDDAVDEVFRVLEKNIDAKLFFLQIKAIIMLFILKRESFVEH
ncbi:MAG: hypothetical protein AB8U93_01175 [Francisella endosymbiont of Hyalomma scupense]